MNEIILEKDEKVFYDVLLSEEIIKEITSLELAMSTSHIASEIESKMSSSSFLGHINELVKAIEVRLHSYLKQDDDINENLYESEYLEELKKIKEEYDKIKQIQYRDFKQSPEIWLQVINLARKCYEVVRDMNFFREYERTKDEILKNIQSLNDSVVNTTLKQALYKEYEQALEQKDLKRLEKIVDFVNQKVLLEWQKIGADLDSMNDDNFCFLGHSTRSTDHYENFFTPLVSTSLFNQEFNDTYKGRFGFIMPPENIVAASSSDLHVDTPEENKEKMFFTTKIAKIDSPAKIINDNLQLRAQNLKKGRKERIYSEVVINASSSFNPIGVFCFTTGALDYDFDYVSAKKLAENNNLPLYTFDILKRKQGSELERMYLEILNNIRRKKVKYSLDFTELDANLLSHYEYFFDHFLKLKARGNYTLDEITSIYDRNLNLILQNISGSLLFSGNYNDNEITTILKANYSYNIDCLIKNKSYSYSALQHLVSELSPFVNKLDIYYPNLSKFIFVLGKMEITTEVVNILKSANTTDLLELTKILALKLKRDLEVNKANNPDSLSKLEHEYQALQTEKNTRTKMQRDYENARKLTNESWSLKYEREALEGFKTELQNIKQEITSRNSKKTSLEIEKEKLEISIEKLNHNRENIVTSSDKPLKALQKLAEKLKRHPYLNYFKLKKLREKVKVLELNKELEIQSKKMEATTEIIALKNQVMAIDRQLATLTNSLSALEQRAIEIKVKIRDQEDLIKSKYGSLDFTIISKKLEEAEIIIAKYDYFNEYQLEKVKQKLEKLETEITTLKEQYESNSEIYAKIVSYVNNKDLESTVDDKNLESQSEINIEESAMFKK